MPECPLPPASQGSPDGQEGHLYFEELVAFVEDYAIFKLNREGIIQDWNLGAERIKLYKADEIVGRHFSCFYSEEDKAAKLPETELVIASETGRFVDEGWRLRKDGTRFWASVVLTALRSHDGEVIGFLKITRDLTERMEATEKLRRSEERFRLLVEGVQDYAIFMIDPEGHVMSWNEGARRIKGYEQEEIIGQHISLFYPEEARAIQMPTSLMRKALRDGRAETEGWRVRKDGTRFWANVVLTAVYDHHGELRGFAKITRDLTDRKEVELLQESDRRKDAFLATLAHELRNPLAPMLAGIDVIVRSPGNDAVVSQVGGMLQRQVGQMSHLIDDLLDMSRVKTGKIVIKKSRVLLGEVIRSAVETVEPGMQEKRHRFSLVIPDESLEMEVDPYRISQVISNLLSNSVKFTPPEGEIRLTAAAESDTLLSVTVSDSGCGIPLALQGKIFGLFEQGDSGSKGGLGIGLTLVKSLVEMHEGSIIVDSAGEGRGCTFRLLLPVLTGKTQMVQAEVQVKPQRSGPARVLVVDDGRNAADILAMFFQMEGFDTAVAYDGAQAVEVARNFDPDLVCMDLGMPRMDGFEAAREIRRSGKSPTLVALSGWGAESDRQRSGEAGFDMHLVKPVKPDDLRAIIARFLPDQQAK